MRLDMNENPGGVPKRFLDTVLQEITPAFLSTYPEPGNVKRLIAEDLLVEVDNVFLGNGSDACIRYIFEVFCKANGNVVTVSPTFEMYAVYCRMFNLEHRAVSYKEDLTIDIKDIIAQIDEDTSLIVLLNPNNPIGNVYEEQEVLEIINKAQNAVIVIDEAYHYFYNKTFLELTKKFNNVVVLRTFSKLMSLAACRLRIAIANSDLIHVMQNAQPTFEVNSIALKFAEHILRDKGLINELIETERGGHSYLVNILKENGYYIMDGRGNYIFIKTNKAPHIVAKALEQEKILVKTYKYPMLQQYIRVSTGHKKYMQLFLDKFLEIDK